MRLELSVREFKHIIFAALVLGFVFGFNDGREVFELGHWLSNYFLMVILSAIMILLFILITKWSAHKNACSATCDTWRITRFGLATKSYYSKTTGKGTLLKTGGAPIGLIIPVVIALATFGKVPFAATSTFNIKEIPGKRLGKKFHTIREIEIAKIACAGSLGLVIITLLLHGIFPEGLIVNTLKKMGLAIAITNLIPFPGLNGLKAFFGSQLLYVFTVIFTLAVTYLVLILGFFPSLLLALLIALIILIVYYYFVFVR